jgi:hypothetical protein
VTRPVRVQARDRQAVARRLGIKLAPGPNKFGAVPVEVDGQRWASTAEFYAQRHLEERRLAGVITEWRKATKYDRVALLPSLPDRPVRGRDQRHYTPDYVERLADGIWQLVECKGGQATMTEAFRLRMHLLRLYQPQIRVRIVSVQVRRDRSGRVSVVTREITL